MARRRSVSVLLATCFGIGWLPKAPGTWGSVAGLLLGALSVPLGWGPAFWAGCLLIDFVLCVWICGMAEKALGKTDPGEIVLDEAWAMAYVVIFAGVGLTAWPQLLVLFVLFRIFDIAKPFPLKRLARLPRGWGIVADDAGAAIYALLVFNLLRQVWVF